MHTVLIEKLSISKLEERDEQEVIGYFEALDTIAENYESISISESQIIDFDTAELARRKTQKQQDVNSISTNDNYANAAFDTPLPTLTRSQSAKLYKYLKIWGSDESNINQIGLSPVIEDTNQYKQTMYTTANYEKEAFGIEPAEEIPDPLDKTLKFQYPQKEKISNIIQDVVLNSKYIQDSLDQDRDDGNKAFFKIEQMVFIEDESPINSDIGRPRMTYVYNVVPYFVDESKVAAPNEVGKNTSGKKAVAPKEYSYMYTGKNEDVLDFNINFNLTNEFEELNDDWDIVSYTTNKIELIDISGGNGGTDNLVFEVGAPTSNCDSNTQSTVQNNVQMGTWRITSFVDSGTDETNDFTGYNFTFSSTGNLNANNGTNDYNGTWSITDSNSNDDSTDDLDFNINFNLTNDFQDLNDDWDFISQTSTKVELIDVSGGNGGTDYLTFEKN